ncbi:MAG TPA: hypothetical protein VKR53_20715, partial [Puia sp.]|nr:hypothetical protein [Puia sp.]
TGIKNYFQVHDPDLKNHAIALIIMLFTLMVGQYSQIAMGIDPQTFYFLGTLVIFIRMPVYDKKLSQQEPSFFK